MGEAIASSHRRRQLFATAARLVCMLCLLTSMHAWVQGDAHCPKRCFPIRVYLRIFSFLMLMMLSPLPSRR